MENKGGSHPEAFSGNWTVDNERSDSIEPMLKAMGVGKMVRKVAQSVKVIQKISVKDNQFIVVNVHRFAEDETIHYMNVGDKVILTPNGEKVIDNCTFDPTREFPIIIKAVLPQEKGETEDKRKLSSDGNSFIQHLTFKPPATSKSTDDILMKRIFVRVDDKGVKIKSSKPIAKANSVNAKKKQTRSVENTQSKPNGTSRGTNAKVSPSPSTPSQSAVKTQKTTEIKPSPVKNKSVTAVKSDTPVTSDAAEGASSEQIFLWVFSSLTVVGMMLLAGIINSNILTLEESLPALVALVLFFIYSRLNALFSKGSNNVFSWIFVQFAVFVFMFIDKYLMQPNNVDTGNETLVYASIAYAVGVYAVSRYCAIILDTKNSSDGIINRLKKMEVRERWLLLASIFVACTVLFSKLDLSKGNFDVLNPNHTALGLLIGLFIALRLSMLSIGNDVLRETLVDSTAGKKKSGETNISVKVVDHRIVDEIYTQYKVEVQCDEGTYYLWRRFSQFDSLRSSLREKLGAGILPKLPAKRIFSNMDPNFLDDRQEELDVFLNGILECESGKEEMLKMAPLKQFLGLGQGRVAAMVKKAKQEAEKDAKNKKDPNTDEKLVKNLIQAKTDIQKAASIGEGDGWKFIGKRQEVQCYLKKGPEGHTFTKGVGVVDAPADVVIEFMSDPDNRKKYDEMFKKATLLADLDLQALSQKMGLAKDAKMELAGIQWSEFKSPFPSLVTARDICTLSCRWKEANGKIVVILVSADEYKKPLKQYVRAKVTAGVIIEPLPNNSNKCTMTNITMMDPNGSIPQWIINSLAPERCAQSAKINALVKDPAVWAQYK